MSERPVKGDIPDESPIPEDIRKQTENDPAGEKDNPDYAPESGDKRPD